MMMMVVVVMMLMMMMMIPPRCQHPTPLPSGQGHNGPARLPRKQGQKPRAGTVLDDDDDDEDDDILLHV